MGILTRYLIRAHAGPFIFALSAVTGLLFLNAVAQRMENLVGKGLPWKVIGEFMLLSLPHTVALTLPMAVLVAVLYTLSELTASNEITAMAAGGVRPLRIMAPLLVVGAVLAGVMLYFNDRVLPEANHRLRNLLIEISTVSPTLDLREHVVNRLDMVGQAGNVYLEFREIDRTTNELTDVVIYDLTQPQTHVTTYAQRATMLFNEARTDLYLTLYEGYRYQVSISPPGEFGRTEFESEILPIRGVASVMRRQTGGVSRSDREMSIGQLEESGAESAQDAARVRQENLVTALAAVREALGMVSADTVAAAGTGRLRAPTRQLAGFMADRDDMTARTAQTFRQNLSQVNAHERRVDMLAVEVHKKYAIAVACIVFVLLGAPVAIRFPRGGAGMVIAVSVAIFAIYWAGLIGGEQLADSDYVSPWLAMWGPDILFTIMGGAFATRMSRQAATSRGGSWDDVVYPLRRLVRRIAPTRLRGSEA